jgi:hypothetical protein
MPLPKIGVSEELSPVPKPQAMEVPNEPEGFGDSDAMIDEFGDSDAMIDFGGEPVIQGEDDAMSGADCSMVFVLPAKYAKEVENDHFNCNLADISDLGGKEEKILPSSKAPETKSDTTTSEDKVTAEMMCFPRPTKDMANQLRPLYITAHLQGAPINKILVDNGSAVNVLPFRSMQTLGMDKYAIQPTSLIVKNFTGSITRTHGLLFVQVMVGSRSITLAFFVVDCTSPYNALLGRDWIHRSLCVPSSLHQSLIMWNEETGKAEHIPADPRPYSVSANATDASYYFSSIAPLRVSGIDQNGRPTGVTAYDLTQWGMTQAQEDMERPFVVVPAQGSNDV